MHIITTGTVAMFNAAGEELGRFEDGDFFGELFLFEYTSPDYYIVSLETTETYSLTKDDFTQVMNESDRVYFERAKLIVCNAIDLDSIFEELIENVIRSVIQSTTQTTVDHSKISLYQYNP